MKNLAFASCINKAKRQFFSTLLISVSTTIVINPAVV